ncbi:AMP-binding protein [uncultured Litoreibacter sp.]|uniref:AMP-binding protein n=1 Tax=uncultured Litoreibacter sp. TaxID=1392394 RepID=UPI00260C62ED|nr:AMP-binding protein [uncultured Litoreibacter sp.]
MSDTDRGEATVNLEAAAKAGLKRIIVEALSSECYDFLKFSNGETFSNVQFSHFVDQQVAIFRDHADVERCAIWGEKNVWAYATICAALVEEVTFCIIDPLLPAARKDEIISNFQPSLLLSGERVDKIQDHSIGPVQIDVSNTAYVMFTSGSSGHPKGVRISYSNFLTFLNGAFKAFGVTSGDRWANHANLSFDLSLFDLLGSLKAGATLYPVVDSSDKLFPGGFIERNEITVWHSTPTTVRYLIAEQAGQKGKLKKLREILMCGEALRTEWVRYLLENGQKNASVYNCYGPTETTVFCTVDRFSDPKDDRLAGAYAPFGSELEKVKLVFEPVSDDEFEVIIRGDTVGQGYENEATVLRNGYGDDDGGRFFRTGDIAELRGGSAYFKRRSDRQVKIGGNRFELEEAEAILGFHSCFDCVFCVHNDRLHLVVGPGCECSDTRLKDVCLANLPDFAQPRDIIRVSEWPISLNGKLDNKALARLISSED